jgi:large subunit ribosomal protein L18
MADPRKQAERRKARARRDQGRERPRAASVFRPPALHAQVIDVAAAKPWSRHPRSKDMRGGPKTGADIEAAKAGKPTRGAQPPGNTDLVFDRGSYRFHGRVIPAEPREGGLKF